MAVVRILVDGSGLLEQWPALAPGKPRTSEVARRELIARLAQYYDICGTPITVFFVGRESGPFPSTPDVEVVFTHSGQTSAHLVERIVSRMKSYGEVLVVTDSIAEHKTVQSAGGTIFNCTNFIQTLENALSELEHNLTNYNQQERLKFTSGRIP